MCKEYPDCKHANCQDGFCDDCCYNGDKDYYKDHEDYYEAKDEPLEMVSNEELADNEVCEVACLKCLHRWIAVYPTTTWLKELECPCCHNQGFVIKTGQTLPESEDE